MRPKLKDSARPKIYMSPAAAAAAASVTAAYSYKSEKPPELPKPESVYPKQDGSPVLANMKDAKRLLELSLIEVREENSMLKGKIEEINSNHEELSKVLASDYSFFYCILAVTCTGMKNDLFSLGTYFCPRAIDIREIKML